MPLRVIMRHDSARRQPAAIMVKTILNRASMTFEERAGARAIRALSRAENFRWAARDATAKGG
jgi:hypothetical protein